MRIHFIAIGGSAMHNLAIALHKMGEDVSGSDDEIFEPSRSRLEKHGLLPNKMGWDGDRINKKLNAVILGMHARSDNPELIRAKELNIPVYSYPEYLYEAAKDKQRIVIGGSHGKTSITSMVLHVLNDLKMDFDYMVGAQLEGFETMVKISDAPIMIIEGDEYLSSPIDQRPKFHLYRPHIALISGIAWDHINVFPTFENYVEQFRIFISLIEEGGCLIYYKDDKVLNELSRNRPKDIKGVPYTVQEHTIFDGVTYISTSEGDIPLKIFGKHNLQNLKAAHMICKELGIDNHNFYKSIKTFGGASRRMETIGKKNKSIIFKDFAHSPSKLAASSSAVKKQFPDKKLIACMELHTFSSLNKTFLKEYAGSINDADEALIYYNIHTLKHKKLPMISEEEVAEAFLPKKVKVFTDTNEFKSYLEAMDLYNCALLFMSSGNFDGIDINDFAQKLLEQV